MGGPVFRAIAAVSTLGGSELTQKKPFQDPGSDRPIGGAAGGPLRLIPGPPGVPIGSGATALLTLNENLSKLDAQPEPDPVLGESEEERQRRLSEAATEEQRKRAGKGRASTILSGFDEPAATVSTARRFLGGV